LCRGTGSRFFSCRSRRKTTRPPPPPLRLAPRRPSSSQRAVRRACRGSTIVKRTSTEREPATRGDRGHPLVVPPLYQTPRSPISSRTAVGRRVSVRPAPFRGGPLHSVFPRARRLPIRESTRWRPRSPEDCATAPKNGVSLFTTPGIDCQTVPAISLPHPGRRPCDPRQQLVPAPSPGPLATSLAPPATKFKLAKRALPLLGLDGERDGPTEFLPAGHGPASEIRLADPTSDYFVRPLLADQAYPDGCRLPDPRSRKTGARPVSF